MNSATESMEALGTEVATSRRDLVVVDLSGGDRSRRLVRRFTSLLLWLRGVTSPRGRKSLIVAYAPAGDAHSVRWPASAEVAAAADLLSDDTMARIDEQVYAATEQIVDPAAELFPMHGGVSLGKLNRLAISLDLAQFARLRAAVEAALAREQFDSCTIIGGIPVFARALREVMRARGIRVRAFVLPQFSALRRIADVVAPSSIASNVASTRTPTSSDLYATEEFLSRRPRTRILEVGETTPISQMLETVENHLVSTGIESVTRVQYSNRRRDHEIAPRLTVTYPLDPFSAPPARSGRFRSAAANAMRRTAALSFTGKASNAGFEPLLGWLVEGLYPGSLDRQAEHIDHAARVLDAARPELLIVGNDRWWIGQTYVHLARARGIPSLCVQDGALGVNAYSSWIEADFIAVNGRSMVRILEPNGFAPRAVITGQPRYDALFALRGKEHQRRARTMLGLDPDACYVLFAAQPMQDAEYARQVLDALAKVSGIRIILRPHPSTPSAFYVALAASYAADLVTVQAAPAINDLLCAADLIVTQHSTVAIEAAILDTPVITANFTGLPDALPYVRLGLSTAARTPAELTDAVARVVKESGTDGSANARARLASALEELIGPLDAGATRRVGILVQGMLAGVRSLPTAS